MSQDYNDGGRVLPARAEVAVVGAGAAGLGVAASLRRRGIEAIVLERSAVASSWRARYEGVRLNTVRWMSSLPGMGIPRSAGMAHARRADRLHGALRRARAPRRAHGRVCRTDRA